MLCPDLPLCGFSIDRSYQFPALFPVSPSNPSLIEGFVFFVVTRTSRLFSFPFISTAAIVFPSNLIRLSFTSLYSLSIGFNGVILLSCDSGNKITDDPLSIMSLIDRLLTIAVRVKNPGHLCSIWRVEWIF